MSDHLDILVRVFEGIEHDGALFEEYDGVVAAVNQHHRDGHSVHVLDRRDLL